MTCIGTSKANGLMVIPRTLACMIKLYCRATIALQNVGSNEDGVEIGNRMVVFHLPCRTEVPDEEADAIGKPSRPPCKLPDRTE